MKFIVILLLTISGFSCSNKSGNPKPVNDSLSGMSEEEWKANWVDSVKSETMRNIYFDTVGVSEGPVKIISARVVEKEYSNYKDVALTYKNVSGKKISAIRFKWYGTNAFNEPADMGISMEDGFGSGFTDDALGVGRSRTSQWNVLSRDAKKIIKAWPYEVAFDNGSTWKSKNN